MPDLALPPGHHYAVMWGIPDNYAGMTNSMLHRSRAFVELAGAEVTILTYEHRDDYDVVRAELRQRGAMVDGMRIANLWEDLRSWDDVLLKSATTTFDPVSKSAFDPLGDRGDHASPLLHQLLDADGTLLQTDYFRADGTLLASDRRRVSGHRPRTFTLCDTSGAPLGSSNDIKALYWLWLDSLPRDPIAWLIADSKTSANHLIDYRRDDVVTIHVVRASHLEPGSARPMGVLRASRKLVMENLAAWDAVVFLTRQQLDDVDALLGPGVNRHVISNSRRVPAELPPGERPTGHGVMLATLVKRKQVAHAITAMKRARGLRRRITLDVWGEGPFVEKLQLAITKSKSPVVLRGHSAAAREEFDTASFSLLTSTSEAFGNVLVESMGRGCIPISYDTPYGPADIISHGVDGFLVPMNDIRALAAQIRRIAGATPAELAPIRAAAHRRALEFDDRQVTGLWAVLMAGLLAARQPA